MTSITTAEAPTTPLPGAAIFVGWDYEQEAFHLEDQTEVITVSDKEAPPISGVSTEPVGRRTPDGKYSISYLAEPEEESFNVVIITLSSDGTVESITQTGSTEYGHGEAILATLRGDQDPPGSRSFLGD
jgi:hypothetical protein